MDLPNLPVSTLGWLSALRKKQDGDALKMWLFMCCGSRYQLCTLGHSVLMKTGLKMLAGING